LTHAYKNLFPDTSASIPAVNTLRSSLSMYVFFVYTSNNIFFLLLVLLTVHQRLLSEYPSYFLLLTNVALIMITLCNKRLPSKEVTVDSFTHCKNR
jgi:hypothetical protein